MYTHDQARDLGAQFPRSMRAEPRASAARSLSDKRVELAHELVARDHDRVSPCNRQWQGLTPQIARRMQEEGIPHGVSCRLNVASARRSSIAGKFDRYAVPSARCSCQ